MNKYSLIGLIGAVISLMCAPAQARPLTHTAPLMSGPPILEVTSPFDEALACLNNALTPEQKGLIFAIGPFPDVTGKVNYAAPDAAGSFLAQNYENALITAFKKTGVRIVSVSGAYRGLYEWSVGHSGLDPRAAQQAGLNIALPDILVQGSMDSLDFISSGGFDADIGIKGSRVSHRILTGFSANATGMPFYKYSSAGEVLSAFSYHKQVVGYQNEFGITDFFGGGSTRSLVGFTIGKQNREALQYVGRSMMDVVAWRIVRDVTGQTVCDQVFATAESGGNVSDARN